MAVHLDGAEVHPCIEAIRQVRGADCPAARQVAGRVGFFLHVDDFDAAYLRMTSAGVQFVTQPRSEPYGRAAVFLDIAGNSLGPSGHCLKGATMGAGLR
ncbi:MAG TPA: VOC family protein [Streptosporangiaceae bacterium]|nr:VOC family protein [Streptosporangiaceae bacterium]